ncbi:hypothetical protein Sala_2881 [Sphingopyxis alaskensis RB2256]|uniref:Uncharacterized protein n=1 Tax=Sphingopyxis alaskensis (strain DSM 13593 / LMG 18877 / RB2256) TaxID=317655 RepID=Q1GP36_SPHAL|nr:hypothetical protein Sala_2881 [Sphingopyxis alaskensis RB2256]
MPLGLGLMPMGVSTSLDTNGKRERSANHASPTSTAKKTLSYMARLCQRSCRLLQYVDKKAATARLMGAGNIRARHGRRGAANGPPHKADLS